MRIAQIAPLAESVPPRLYGGTERVVSYLTEELVAQGHDVTLFASGDSLTAARLVPCSDVSLRLNPKVKDHLPHTLAMLEEVRRRADDFDILHFHIDLLHFPLVRPFAERTLTTLHGRLDLADLKAFYRTFPDHPVASVSDSQRRPLTGLNWAGTVHHGLPPRLLPYQPESRGGYLAFVGRISPEKRPDRALEIAAGASLPLRIAAKIDKADQDYWREVIKPMIDHNPAVEFIGEVDDAAKGRFIGEALALLFPIDWPEPFGLTMIEAMSCGTPVIATSGGSVAEVIEEGISGLIVDDVEAGVRAVEIAARMPRAAVRAAFERRFTVERMTADYTAIYRRLVDGRTAEPGKAGLGEGGFEPSMAV